MDAEAMEQEEQRLNQRLQEAIARLQRAIAAQDQVNADPDARDDTEIVRDAEKDVRNAQAQVKAAASLIQAFEERKAGRRDVQAELGMLQHAMRTAKPEEKERLNRDPGQGDRAAVQAAHERTSKQRNDEAALVQGDQEEYDALDRSREEREREADRDRDKVPSRRRDPYSIALENKDSSPSTDKLSEVEKEFERLMFNDMEFWRLCWNLDTQSGEFFREYVTMDEAEDAFTQGVQIGDGNNIQGETKKCTLRDVPVVIKRHVLYGENAKRGYKTDGTSDRMRKEQAMMEDENHRFIWNSLYTRGYRTLAAKLSYPACMDFSKRSHLGFWYTVQTLVDAGPNVRAFSLKDFVERFGRDGWDVLSMRQRANLAWQYGTMTAAFHTAKVFHHDLHWENMLVLWPINGGDADTVPQLRVIDWGMATIGGFKFVKDENGKLVPCGFPELTHNDHLWIDEDDLDDLLPRPGVTIEDDPDPNAPKYDDVENYRLEIFDKDGESFTPKRYCLTERLLGPYALWMDLPQPDQYYLIKRIVVAYKTFLTKDANRLAIEMAKAGHYFASVKTRARTLKEEAEASADRWAAAAQGPPPAPRSRTSTCTVM